MNCGHVYHIKCFRNHLKEKLRQYKYKFKCQTSGCSKDIKKSLLQDVLCKDNVIKIDYLTFVFRASYNSTKAVFWCSKDNRVFLEKSAMPNCSICGSKGVNVKSLIKNIHGLNTSKTKQLLDNIEKQLYEAFKKCTKCNKPTKPILGYTRDLCICAQLESC